MEEEDFIIRFDEDNYRDSLCKYRGNDSIVEIPEGVEMIRQFAFASDFEPNETIEKIILPSSMISLDREVFAYCKNLKEIVFNKELKDIGFDPIRGCDSIEEITIPPKIKSITSLSVPSTIKKITVNDNLERVEQLGFYFFDEGINRDPDYTTKILLQNPVYKVIDGFMVNTKLQTTLYRVDKSQTSVRIPDGIKVIGEETFTEMFFSIFDYGEGSEIRQIESVIIPSSVKKINGFAFDSCQNLTSVTFEGDVNKIDIDENAFHDCKNLNFQKPKNTKRITHIMLDRFKVIHKKIKSGTYPNTEMLRKSCCEEIGLGNKLSIATISRDLEFLRNSLNAPIEFDRFKNGYFYSDDFELTL